MTTSVRSIQTDSGEIKIRDVGPGTLGKLGTLFPRVGWIEDDGRRLLALMPIHGSRTLHGLRTGYGWYSPEQRDEAEKLFPIERLRIIEAIAALRARGFHGVLMPAACLSGGAGEHSQLGELLFLHAEGPLDRSALNGDPVQGYEEQFGTGATDVLLSFVLEIGGAWKRVLNGPITITDLEPCPAVWPGVHWRADVVLVDDTIIAVHPELEAHDSLLNALVQSGVTEIEYTPSVILIQSEESPVPANGAATPRT